MTNIVADAPICHFTPMHLEHGDDIGRTVFFWECERCSHTKDAWNEWREG